MRAGTKALYISYDGVLEPLGRSQVIAYIKGLNRRGIRFVLISFEKKGPLEDVSSVKNTRRELENNGITWIPLRYHKRPTVPATFYDVLQGIVVGGYFIVRKKLRIVHARSYVAALMALVLKGIFRVRFIFDMRGFWIDERIDMKLWPPGSILYKIAKAFEKVYLTNADRIIVLTNKAEEEVRNFDYMKMRRTPIEVISTCVDLKKFRHISDEDLKKKLGLNGKFVFIYSGTIYCLKQMLDFYQVVKNRVSSPYFLFLVNHGEEILRKEIMKMGFEPEEYSIQHIPHDEMSRWISLGNIAVMFIERNLSRKGSCPTKLAEFLACGLPVITNSGIGDVDEILLTERVGSVVKDFSEGEYLRVMEEMGKLLQDKDLKERARRTALKYFCLEEGVEKYLRLYRESDKLG